MAPAALGRLIASQLAREGEITRLEERLMNRPRESISIDIVQSRLDVLKEIWKEIRVTHREIIGKENAGNDEYMTNDWYGRIEDLYENVYDRVLTLLAEVRKAGDTTDRAASSDTAVSGIAKLPRISLPTFSGKYEDWASFRDLFTTLIHDVPSLADATKLQYLKLCLTDRAADLIKDVTTTSANYASTWQALETRFHNPRLIINKLLTSLMDIPYSKKDSASSLRSFVDEAQRIVRALANLKLPVKHWDVFLIFVLSERLDSESRKLWECELSQVNSGRDAEPPLSEIESLPKFVDFIRFLEQRTQALTMIAPERRAEKRAAPSSSVGPQARKVFHAASTQSSKVGAVKCSICSGTHPTMKCVKLKGKNPSDRYTLVRQLQLCYNCLGQHRVSACPSAGRCSVCQRRHHSLLHLKGQGTSQAPSQSISNPQLGRKNETTSNNTVVNLHAAQIATSPRRIILATARVLVEDQDGNSTLVRALLDQGSESSFISESIVQLLGLSQQQTCVALSGLGSSAAGTARSKTQFISRSNQDSRFKLETEALILPRLTSNLPSNSIGDLDLQQFAGLPLADSEFSISKRIDVILGADVYGQLLRSGLKRFSSSSLVAQNTVFGWVISGSLQPGTQRRAEELLSPLPVHALHCSCDSYVDETLQRFWSLEEVGSRTRDIKPEDVAVETLFQETHSRDSQGRYVVSLPVKDRIPLVAVETRRMALSSLSNLHRRLSRDMKLSEAYRTFMSDYERLGHMTPVPPSEVENVRAWYLPHHPVVQASQSNWKLRVVFDASRKTRQGNSLNEFLLPGPPLQGDLSLILLNWRKYPFAFTADIVKMFRQIRVRSEDQDLQRIVWSPSSSSTPVDYRLNTVTYGTACAPFLAIRTLLQLIHDEGSRFPLGAECLKKETYVDDTFAGADDLPSAIQKRLELTSLLESAGLKLDKWSANHAELLPSSAGQGTWKQIDVDTSVKTLGIQWNPSQDVFRFTALEVGELSAATTKRSILSNISRLFDPLGWLAPVTVTAKILMQDLWIQKCDWDSPLPAGFQERWYAYCKSLVGLSSVSINRWLGVAAGRTYQIHGFSDASSRAYAAAVYLRIVDSDSQVRVTLLTAKSKVAPVKTVSIPNLELCGASLLVKLISHVRQLEFLNSVPVFTWSDSQIVLMWLRKHPCHWKTFVANRVSYIQTELPTATWAHVPTKENPADLATRGSEPDDLARSKLWWHGPEWLCETPEKWPQPPESQQVLHSRALPAEPEILTRVSTLTGLIRVVAFCRRPLLRLRRRAEGLDPLPSFLTSLELSEAKFTVIRMSQAWSFSEEIETLRSGRDLPKRSRLNKLNPFLCTEGVLRVGGRLTHSNLPFEGKHPPILDRHSALSIAFARHAHCLCLHGGPTLTTSVLMQQVWILGRIRVVKSMIRNCVICQRVKPQSAQQLMGDLPADRVLLDRPFSISGLDYAGPVQVRTTKGRGHKSYKGYIVLFVCFATRAIHLELVSDLTSASFISAYRRFVGRRGICRRLYSDNATNFHGADSELKAMFQRASTFYQACASTLANDGTDWTFIPPSAPHYGGLWEAGVRSVKHHLKRAVGEHTLTFEELSTVLVEIEACLNSRPLGALSSDVEDLQALTPFHFISGSTSALLPDADLPAVPENRLDRFQLLQRIRNQFWKRWSSEYLLHLQEREKWRDVRENFCLGKLVLVKDDRYPPSKWPLGRIVELHPGPDNLVRVVSIKTGSNTLRRHISRLSPLHLDSESKSN